jgi:dGTPase
MLASYASHLDQSRGRLYSEPASPVRNLYQRDRDRIVHATAFRRLQYKTQVFANYEGDHYRTRLTHTIEVAQISRTLALSLGLDEALTEAVALAHDLGHPPFGHAGEDALNEKMKEFGGFEHNVHTIRLITYLEQRYANFDGLNLTWEVLEGIIKHNGPLTGPFATHLPKDRRGIITALDKSAGFELGTHPSIEAQMASLADDIAYLTHDLEDGLRADMITQTDLQSLPLFGDVLLQVERDFPGANWRRAAYECISALTHLLVMDVIAATKTSIQQHGIQTVAEARAASMPIACFSKDVELAVHTIKAFLRARMYHHYQVNRMTSRARKILTSLFDVYFYEPDCLPTEWQEKFSLDNTAAKAIVVCDYIAGMTDRFALREYEAVCNPTYGM